MDFSLQKVLKHEETCDAYRIYISIMEDKAKKGEVPKTGRKPRKAQQCSVCYSYEHNASWHTSPVAAAHESLKTHD